MKIVHVVPGIVTIAGHIVPGSAIITPLDGVAIGAVTGCPGPGTGGLGDVVAVLPFGRITRIVLFGRCGIVKTGDTSYQIVGGVAIWIGLDIVGGEEEKSKKER